MTSPSTMEKILVAVDGSEPSRRAARLAADIAERFGARMTLLYVVPPVHLPAEAAIAVDVERVERDHEAYAQRLLRETVAALGRPGVPMETLVVRGDPAHTISETASALGADLVALGSHGRGAVARAVLGSVSTRVLHICTRPVLVVR